MPPAARLTDPHTCPVHGGGPLGVPGAPTVLIGGLAAARVTDVGACPGAPDAIIKGSPSVLIGGLPAARMGDATVHGGLIVKGCLTVEIGEGAAPGPVTFPFAMTGTPAEMEQLQGALALLYSTPTGRTIIERIANSGHTVTLEISSGGSQCAPHDPAQAAPGGKGSASTVSWNPSDLVDGLPAGDPRSGAVVLGHELVHAEHNATATEGNGPYETHPGQQGGSWHGEERQTVGSAPPYDASGHPVVDQNGNPGGTHVRDPSGNYVADTDHSHATTSENAIRDDFGLPRRGTYYPSNWAGGPPW